MSTKTRISQFPNSTEVNDSYYFAAVVDNGDGTFTNEKVPYDILVPATTSPDLQTVTDTGNTTSNSIEIERHVDSGESFLILKDIDNPSNYFNFIGTPTDALEITIPDKGGTLAMLDDITTSDLQAVTDLGNTTTNDLVVTSDDGLGIMSYKDGSVEWHSDFTTFTRTLNFGTPSSDQNYFLPETGGTLATDLQTATDGGATTSNNMTVADGGGIKAVHATEGFGVLDADDNYLARIYNDGGNGSVSLGDATYSIVLAPDALTVSHTQRLQDNTGTVALEEFMTLDKVLTAGDTTGLRAQFENTSGATYITINDFSVKSGFYTKYTSGAKSSAQYDYAGIVFGQNDDVDYLIISPPATISGGNQIRFPNSAGTILVGNKGTATLSSGTVTISDTNVKSTSVVNALYLTPAGTIGVALKATVSAGSGFTISAITAGLIIQTLDTSTVQYTIVY